MNGRKRMLKWIRKLFAGPEVDYSTEQMILQTKELPSKLHEQPVATKQPKKKKLPDFNKMTKTELDVWAKDTIGLNLDRRRRKDYMIKTIKERINKEK